MEKPCFKNRKPKQINKQTKKGDNFKHSLSNIVLGRMYLWCPKRHSLMIVEWAGHTECIGLEANLTWIQIPSYFFFIVWSWANVWNSLNCVSGIGQLKRFASYNCWGPLGSKRTTMGINRYSRWMTLNIVRIAHRPFHSLFLSFQLLAQLLSGVMPQEPLYKMWRGACSEVIHFKLKVCSNFHLVDLVNI